MVSRKDVKEQMRVVDAEGQTVGTVDRCEKGQIKLRKDASGQHHFVDMDLVDRIDGDQVRLKNRDKAQDQDKGASSKPASDRASG